MNCSRSSDRRKYTQVLAAVFAVGILTVTGCGDDDTEGLQSAGDDTAATSPHDEDDTATASPLGQDDSTVGSVDSPRPSLPPGPQVDDGVVADQLVVTGAADSDYVVARIEDAGGTVVEETNEGTLRVRFDVNSLDELLEIRDELRAVGIDAAVIAELGPDSLGDGSDENPA